MKFFLFVQIQLMQDKKLKKKKSKKALHTHILAQNHREVAIAIHHTEKLKKALSVSQILRWKIFLKS